MPVLLKISNEYMQEQCIHRFLLHYSMDHTSTFLLPVYDRTIIYLQIAVYLNFVILGTIYTLTNGRNVVKSYLLFCQPAKTLFKIILAR